MPRWLPVGAIRDWTLNSDWFVWVLPFPADKGQVTPTGMNMPPVVLAVPEVGWRHDRSGGRAAAASKHDYCKRPERHHHQRQSHYDRAVQLTAAAHPARAVHAAHLG